MFDCVLNASLEYGHMKNEMKKEKWENSQLYLRLEKLRQVKTVMAYPHLLGKYLFKAKNKHGLLKYTAIYITLWRRKLRGQFSENLVLWISLHSGDRISKEKKIVKALRIKNIKHDRNFQLTNCFLINILLFLRIKQTSQTEVRK